MKTAVINETVYRTILPLQPKDSLSSNIFVTKGSQIGYYSDKTLRFFCAWKRKDNERGRLDLDFGAIMENEKSFSYCDFTNQKPDFAKHSGDFTSCREFNEKNPIITAEIIDIDLTKIRRTSSKIMFYVSSYNSVKIEDYDVYFGFIEEDKINNEDFCAKVINLNDAAVAVKIESDFDNCYVCKLSENRIYFMGEPFKGTGCSHSHGGHRPILNKIDTYYNFHKFMNLGVLFNYILTTKGYKICSGFDIPPKVDLLITNDYGEYENVEKVYRIYEHQDEIKELLNTNNW